jgi:VCBS repeat-containing protein
VLANDTDAENNALSALLLAGPSHGTLTLNESGSFTYTPAENFNGSDSFTYKANDGSADSNTATVSITVNAVNDAPVVTTSVSVLAYTENDPATAIDTSLTVSDVDSSDLIGATVSITTNFASGQDVLSFLNTAKITGHWDSTTGILTLTGMDTSVNYEAALRSVKYQNTSDNPTAATRTVSFEVDDGSLVNNLSNTATRNITVTAVNDAPTLTTINTLTGASEDIAFNISYATLLAASDAADVDGGTLSFRIESVTSGTFTKNGVAVVPGTTLLDPNETLVWTPDKDANGTLSAFTVKAFDGSVASDTPVQVKVQVVPVNDAPTLTTINTLTGATEDTAFNISYATLLAASNAADVDSSPISFKIEAVSGGTLTKNGVAVVAGTTVLGPNETLVWTPSQDANGLLNAFTVKAFDGLLASASAVQVQIQVAAVNDAPIADAGPDRIVRLGSLVTLNGSGSGDPDHGPSPLSYSWTQSGGPGTTLTGANTSAPTFNPTVAGLYTFNLVVNDGQTSSIADSVTITVPALGSIDLDGDVDTDDLKILMAGLNTAATGPNDLRDLDGDGMITVLDMRKLTLLYTRPRGATK